nr:hypothetical protein [uncultured Kingella sp.]
MTRDEIDAEIQRYADAINEAWVVINNEDLYHNHLVESARNVVNYASRRISELSEMLGDDEIEEYERDAFIVDAFEEEQDELDYAADLEDYDLY